MKERGRPAERWYSWKSWKRDRMKTAAQGASFVRGAYLRLDLLHEVVELHKIGLSTAASAQSCGGYRRRKNGLTLQ